MKYLTEIILASTLISIPNMPSYIFTDNPNQSTSSQKTKEEINFEKLYKQLGSDSFRKRRKATNTLIQRVNEINIEDICKLYGSDSPEVKIRAKKIALHLMRNKENFDIGNLVELYGHEDPKVSSNAEKLFHDSIDCPEKFPKIRCLPSCTAGIKNDKYKHLEKFIKKYLRKAYSLNLDQKYPERPYYNNSRVATHLLIKYLKESGENSSQEIKEILKLGWQGEKKWRISLIKKHQIEIEKYSPIPSTLLKE